MTASRPALPYGATAVRPHWTDLPEALRARIEERLGGTVVAAASQDSGFTPAFASRLVYAKGEHAFVKAVSTRMSPAIADSYRNEARTVSKLPASVPAPALRWTFEELEWVVLCFDDVPGHPPARPWQPRELTDVLTALTSLTETLTPAPGGLLLPQARDWLVQDFGYWRQLLRDGGGTPDRQVAELAALEDDAPEALRGDAVIHCDLRDDNVLVGDDGAVWFCDWSWPSRGPAWLDLVTLLISVRGDGYDADALLAAHPLGEGVDADVVDAVLAGLGGYFTRESLQPKTAGSPYLRAHHSWYAEATLSWLAIRRGWVG